MMAAALPPGAQDRLIKLAGLLGSDFDGERSNAAAAATRLLQDNGLTWRDLLTPALPRPRAPIPTGWRAVAADCALMPELLTAWERDFLRGLPAFPRLSMKQQATLARIAQRVLVDRA